MPELPKIVVEKLAKGDVRSNASHPDADLLTAFVEQALPDRERSPILSHLADCAPCREIVALAQSLEDAPSSVFAPRKRRRGLFLLRWGLLTACAVVAVSLAVFRNDFLHKPAAVASIADQRPAEPSLPSGEKVTLEAKVLPPDADRLAKADGVVANGIVAKKDSELKIKSPNPVLPLTAPSMDEASNAVGAYLKRRRVAPGVHGPAAPLGNNAFGYNNNNAVNNSLANAPAAQQMWDAPAPQPGAVAETRAAASPASASSGASAGAPVGGFTGAILAQKAAPARADAKAADNELTLKKEQAQPKQKASNQVAVASESVEVDASTTSTTTAYAPTDKDDFRASSAEIVNLPVLGRADRMGSWQVTESGALQRSLDGGKSWESVSLNPSAHLRVVAATGFHVWAGGNAGALFHSQDAGVHFVSVKVHKKHATLTGDIVTLAFTDAQHGRLETSDHEVWMTTDDGKTWIPSAPVK